MTPGHDLPYDVNCSILFTELPLLEPLSGSPRYPLRTAADAVAVLDRIAAATGVANLGRLAAAGYRGWVGLEYVPDGPSADSFGWLPRERRQGGTP